MKRNYHTEKNEGKANERKLAEFLVRHGRMLLPMVQLVEQARLAVDEVIDVVGRKTIEAVLWLSAQQVAGMPQQGRKREGEIFRHGTQGGSVYLKERKLAVNKPRLRKKRAEVAIPAYQAMQDRAGLGARMLDIVLNGVSTRGLPQDRAELSLHHSYKDVWALKAILQRGIERAPNSKEKVA